MAAKKLAKEEMLAALMSAYEDACGKPPRGTKCKDPDWLAEQTRAALVATSIREAAAKSAGEDIAAAALEAEIKRRGLMRKPVTVESRRIPRASGFRGVGRHKACKWKASIYIDKKSKPLGYFEGTARGEVDAALAYDAAARAAGRPEKANFELAAASGAAQPPQIMPAQVANPAITIAVKKQVGCVQCDRCGKWRELPDVDGLPDKWFCELNADREYSSCDAVEQEWSDDEEWSDDDEATTTKEPAASDGAAAAKAAAEAAAKVVAKAASKAGPSVASSSSASEANGKPDAKADAKPDAKAPAPARTNDAPKEYRAVENETPATIAKRYFPPIVSSALVIVWSAVIYKRAAAEARTAQAEDRRRGARRAEPRPLQVRKLGQVQPFIAVVPQECMGQLASFGPT